MHYTLEIPDGPPPFEATCFRPCKYPPETRTCMLADWVIEWYIGGNSPLCEGCLFNYTAVNDTYEDPDFQLRDCTDCIPLDGVSRAVAVVNRQMPGPAVQVRAYLIENGGGGGGRYFAGIRERATQTD